MRVSLLDYGAGNVRSLINALEKLGFEIEFITSPEQIATAQVLLFPGVGSFGQCMQVLREKNYEEALRQGFGVRMAVYATSADSPKPDTWKKLTVHNQIDTGKMGGTNVYGAKQHVATPVGLVRQSASANT